MSNSQLAQSLRAFAVEEGVSESHSKELADLADKVEAHEGAVGAGPVGSDLSVFIRNISLIGFIPALIQFIKDIFNIK